MKVLLTKDVSGLGRAGDVKEVSDGHARNFLIPRHLVLPATSEVLARVQKEEGERQAKLKKQEEFYRNLVNKLTNKTFVVRAKVDKGHLFAQIKPSQVKDAINDKMKLELTDDQIEILKPIKSLGLHEVNLRLAPAAQTTVKLSVEAT